jgi:DNA transformation protein
MSRSNSFKDYIVEDVLGHVDGITSKGMFSGHCIFLDGLPVGLIIDGEFYLKADKLTMAKYKKEGDKSFCYEKPDGKIITMSYMNVPIETLEDREKIEARLYESFEISKKTKK